MTNVFGSIAVEQLNNDLARDFKSSQISVQIFVSYSTVLQWFELLHDCTWQFAVAIPN